MHDGQLFTWGALGTMSGASLLTFLVVLYMKEIVSRIAPKLPTALFAVIVAFVILVLAQIAIGANGLDWRIYVLALANGFLVALAAGHMNDKALNPPGAIQKQNAPLASTNSNQALGKDVTDDPQ